MTIRNAISPGAALACAAILAAGCGSSSKPASSQASSQGPTAGVLSAEAKSAATGDIPDNQMFLTFHDPAARFSIKYPEGWEQRGTAGNLTFQSKNNVVHILVRNGSSPTTASVAAALAAQRAASPSLRASSPVVVRVAGAPAIKASYTTTSAPNPVTGKRVELIVDRYGLSHAGRVATVDLGTAKGVDNIDAYRMMIGSFRWR
jgi:hypothetical protein